MILGLFYTTYITFCFIYFNEISNVIPNIRNIPNHPIVIATPFSWSFLFITLHHIAEGLFTILELQEDFSQLSVSYANDISNINSKLLWISNYISDGSVGSIDFLLIGVFKRLVFKRNLRNNERNFYKEIVSFKAVVQSRCGIFQDNLLCRLIWS